MPGEKAAERGTDKRVRLVPVHRGIQQGGAHHIHDSARAGDDQNVLLGNFCLENMGREVARKAFLQIGTTVITGGIPTSEAASEAAHIVVWVEAREFRNMGL